MECNTKTVEICSNKCLFEKETEIFIESEFSLPDYYSPIKRVLNCKCEPAISSKNITGNTVNIDGVTSVKLIYCDDMNELCSFESGLVFTKNIDTGFDVNRAIVKAEILGNKLNFNVKSERRFDVKGSLIVKVTVYEISKTKCLSDISDKNFEIKCCSMPLKESIRYSEKNIIIDDELALSESHAKIGKILNYNGIILPDESKMMNGKVMLKGTVLVNITYLTDNDCKPCHLQHKIPYSQVCDIEGLNEEFNCSCNEKLIFLEVKCRNNSNDESRTICINAKLCIEIEAYLEKENMLVSDVYALRNNIETNECIIESSILKERISEVFSAKKTLEFSESGIGTITDIWSDVKITGVSQKENYILVFGIVYIKMILCDNSGNYEYIERTVDFEYKYKTEYYPNNHKIDAKATLSNMSYIIVSENSIEVLCNLIININVIENREERVISEINVSESNTDTIHNCSLYVCYLDKETDLWEIAKNHRSSINDIREINGIDSSQNCVNGPILIPVK